MSTGPARSRWPAGASRSYPACLHHHGDPLDAVPHLDSATIRELARRHEQRLIELDGGRARRVVSKMPENYFYLGLIALMFPDAIVIHCRRDLRDVALSCWTTNFTEVRWASHFDHIASRFEGYRRLMDHWTESLPPAFAIHEVAYEDAVADLEGALAGSSAFWDWIGTRLASNSTGPAGPSRPPARRRSASRSIEVRSGGGSSTGMSWASCSPRWTNRRSRSRGRLDSRVDLPERDRAANRLQDERRVDVPVLAAYPFLALPHESLHEHLVLGHQHVFPQRLDRLVVLELALAIVVLRSTATELPRSGSD